MPNGGENGDPENIPGNGESLLRYSPEYVPGQHYPQSIFLKKQ
jgi:hypothetical protein